MIDFCKWFWFAGVMKAELRISIKDYHRNKNLKVLLFRPPFPSRGYWVRMSREGPGTGLVGWPKDGRPVSMTRLMAALRRALVKASGRR